MTGAADIETALARMLTEFQRFGAHGRRRLGLSRNEEAVLLCLGRGITAPAEVSREVGMTTAGMTNLLDRLERDGFLRREPHASDKRRVLLTLTKRGYRSQLELDELHERIALRVSHDATADQLEALAHFLRVATAEIEGMLAELAEQAEQAAEAR